MENALRTENLSYSYPDGTTALQDLNLEVEEGSFFGFLGPNGAGKTTLIKTLSTRLQPDSGSFHVNGFGPGEPRKIRRSIGYMSQDISLDDELTARENLVYACRSYGIRPSDRKIEKLLELAGLADVADKKPKKFSIGMRKRLDATTALVHEPPVVFLDEPTTGLDPEARERLWNYFREINERGATVFLTTQNLMEADELAETIALIEDGRIVEQDRPAALKEKAGENVVEIHTDVTPDRARNILDGTVKEEHMRAGETLKIHLDGFETLSTLVQPLEKENVKIKKIDRETADLDDVFLSLTGGAD